MRSRAAILPHFGDPACLYYWLGWFSSVWHEEVDALYVGSSNILNEEHLAVIKAMLDAAEKDTGVEIIFVPSINPVQHGDQIARLLVLCKQDLVVLMEEDTVVFQPKRLDAAFKRIESGEVDVVGSSRGSCSEIINIKSQEKYGPIARDEKSFDSGYNFWPNFYFGKRTDLLRTDGNFNAFGRTKGTAIPELGIDSLPEDIYGDTFVWTSIQLRNMGLKFGYVEQYHGHFNDLSHFHSRVNVFSGSAGWVHHGSLSGWKDLLNPEVQKRDGMEDGEMARRLQWYKTFIEFFEQTGLLPGFTKRYKNGVNRIMSIYGLTPNYLEKWQLIYKRLFEGRLYAA